MNTVCKENACSGCMACLSRCPKDAIIIEDSVFAYNARIDPKKCINCNACHKVCQVNHSPEKIYPISWYEGWAEDESIRRKSSSGGLASALEKDFIKSGGYVCSCVFRDGEFRFKLTSDIKEIECFAGSKYVRSNPVGIYPEILTCLKEGNRVLFVGLPCQVAAVRNFCGDHENLYTVDLICHGTPSPQVLASFLDEHHQSLKPVHDIRFREKEKMFVETDGKRVVSEKVIDDYTQTFLDTAIYAENCYNCQYARTERVSDLTLGDSWGSQTEPEEWEKGVSLVLCQTEKGKELLNTKSLFLKDVDLERAVANNHQLNHPAHTCPERKTLLKAVKQGKKFSHGFLKAYPKRWLKNQIKLIGIQRKEER